MAKQRRNSTEQQWVLYSSDWYWDHMIAEDFLALASSGASSPGAQKTIRAWLFCYRQSFELALKSLIRAAEGKVFDQSYRATGSEERHCDVEGKLEHHRVADLADLLDVHLKLCGGAGINDDVRSAVLVFRRIDPDGYRLRFGHALAKAGFAESVPKTSAVRREDLDCIERAVAAMLDNGELARPTFARGVHPDGSECADDEMAIPVRTKRAPVTPPKGGNDLGKVPLG